MTPLPRQGWLFLVEFLKWHFSKYWQVQTRWVFAQTVTFIIKMHCHFSHNYFLDFGGFSISVNAQCTYQPHHNQQSMYSIYVITATLWD